MSARWFVTAPGQVRHLAEESKGTSYGFFCSPACLPVVWWETQDPAGWWGEGGPVDPASVMALPACKRCERKVTG